MQEDHVGNEFYVDIRLRSENELRFRTRLPDSGGARTVVVEVMLHGPGAAEWCGSPLGRDVRYKVAPGHTRVSIFTWAGCTLRLFCRDPAAFLSLEPYVATGVAWHSAVMELHAQLHEMRMQAKLQATQIIEEQQRQRRAAAGSGGGGGAAAAADAAQNQQRLALALAAVSGPTLVIAGGQATGRHQLAMTLANLCARTPLGTTSATTGNPTSTDAAATQQQQQQQYQNQNNASAIAAGCCTVVDADPVHQTCSGLSVPLTVAATVWEQTRVLDDSTSPHMVSFTLAAGRPASPDGAVLSYAYQGAVVKLVKTARQRIEANAATRVGWSGTVVVMPSAQSFTPAAYAALLYRTCETARADRVLFLGAGAGQTKNIMAKLQAEYCANFGPDAAVAARGGGIVSFQRQLRGTVSTVDLLSMAANPASLVASDLLRAGLIADSVSRMLQGNDAQLLPLQQLRRTIPMSAVDIAMLKPASVLDSASTMAAADAAAAGGAGASSAMVMMQQQQSTEVALRVSPEQLKQEGEGRLAAFYATLHDCTNFGQPSGFAVLEVVDVGRREMRVLAGRLAVPAAVLEPAGTTAAGSSTPALVVLPGAVIHLS